MYKKELADANRSKGVASKYIKKCVGAAYLNLDSLHMF
jgi:hypothetical protein